MKTRFYATELGLIDDGAFVRYDSNDPTVLTLDGFFRAEDLRKLAEWLESPRNH